MSASLFFWHRYVKLHYHPVHSLDDVVKVFKQESLKKHENHFVEGLMFDVDRAVIMTGSLSSTCEPGKVSSRHFIFILSGII
jgi:delta24-sterol reductase